MMAKLRLVFIFVFGLLSMCTLPISTAGEATTEVGADGEAIPATPTDDRKLEEMEDEIAALKVIVADTQGKLKQAETSLADVKGKLSTAETDLVAATEKAAAIDARASKAEEELVDAQKKLRNADANLAAAKEKADTTTADHTKCLDDLASTHQRLEAAEVEAKTVTSSVKKLEAKVAEVEAESIKNDEQKAGIVSRMEADVRNLQGRLKETVLEAAAKAEELASSNEELENIKAKMEASYCDVERIVDDAKTFMKTLIG